MLLAQLVRALHPHLQEPMEVDEYVEHNQDIECQDPSGWYHDDFNVKDTEDVPIDIEGQAEDDQEDDLTSQEIITIQQAMDMLDKLKSYSMVKNLPSSICSHLVCAEDQLLNSQA